MIEARPRVSRPRAKRVATGQFVVDRAYVRGQALEAVLTFVAPFTGVYRAVTGASVIGPVTVAGTKASSGFSKPYAKVRAKRKKAKPATTTRS